MDSMEPDKRPIQERIDEAMNEWIIHHGTIVLIPTKHLKKVENYHGEVEVITEDGKLIRKQLTKKFKQIAPYRTIDREVQVVRADGTIDVEYVAPPVVKSESERRASNAKSITTPLGVFASIREASIAHKMTTSAIQQRLKRSPDKFFYNT